MDREETGREKMEEDEWKNKKVQVLMATSCAGEREKQSNPAGFFCLILVPS